MNKDTMIAEEIKEMLEREPFKPFRVTMTSLKEYDIRNPRLAWPLKRELYVAMPDGERVAILPWIHVASIETIKGTRCEGGRRRFQPPLRDCALVLRSRESTHARHLPERRREFTARNAKDAKGRGRIRTYSSLCLRGSISSLRSP